MSDNPSTRMTQQKGIILEELRKAKSHPTAEEIYQAVRRRLPRISLGTVYRNLANMSKGGEVLGLRTAGRRKRFDGNVQEHYHIRCKSCSRIDDLSIDFATGVDQELAKISGYRVTGHSLEFHGLCPKCCRTQTSNRREE